MSRFFISSNPNQANAASEQVLLEIPVSDGHRAGQLAFGPDGFLYVSVGADYQSLSAEDPTVLTGKILRIDVESSITNTYSIPADNPYAGHGAYRREIWALGLRNPFRFSFDRQTGDLYIGDVGEIEVEEINYQPAGSPGGRNYGWPTLEGIDPFIGVLPPGVTWESLVPPIAVYQHHGGPRSVTGGFVYRGPDAPRLNGLYFNGDFILGDVWAVKFDGANWQNLQIASTGFNISSFGEDEAGNLYLVDYGLFGAGGVYRIADNGLTVPPVFDPPSGTSFTELVRVSSPSPGSTVYFTTNGLEPTPAGPMVGPDGIIVVTTGTTIKARAFRDDLLPSTTVEVVYTLKVGPPTFHPRDGTQLYGESVFLTSATPGAIIRYTLDGSIPTSASPVFSPDIVLTNLTTTIIARGFRDGFIDSNLQTNTYRLTVRLDKPVRLGGGGIKLSWNSLAGQNYRVQSSGNLLQWNDASGLLSGTGLPISFTNPPANPGTAWFFRVVVE